MRPLDYPWRNELNCANALFDVAEHAADVLDIRSRVQPAINNLRRYARLVAQGLAYVRARHLGPPSFHKHVFTQRTKAHEAWTAITSTFTRPERRRELGPTHPIYATIMGYAAGYGSPMGSDNYNVHYVSGLALVYDQLRAAGESDVMWEIESRWRLVDAGAGELSPAQKSAFRTALEIGAYDFAYDLVGS